MAKESFLGIKRVEALLKIVDEKRKDALNSIEKIPEHETQEGKINDIKLYYYAKVIDIQREFYDFQEAAKKLVALGFEDYFIRNAANVSFDALYSYLPEEAKGKSVAKQAFDAEVFRINEKYRLIGNRLWLCTSVAEAQEIMEEM